MNTICSLQIVEAVLFCATSINANNDNTLFDHIDSVTQQAWHKYVYSLMSYVRGYCSVQWILQLQRYSVLGKCQAEDDTKYLEFWVRCDFTSCVPQQHTSGSVYTRSLHDRSVR